MRVAGFTLIVALLPALVCRANMDAYDAFRVMTFNICHCATHYSLNVTDEDVRRTANVIAAAKPDFVCLQEVDKCTTRSAGIDQTARIAELLTEITGMRYCGTFGKGRDYQGGGFGVAILSRNEPISVSTTALEGSEPRVLLVCEFEGFFVATVHLDTDKGYRIDSIPVIRDAIATHSKPVFITGDWNATPTSDATLAKMKEFLTVISPENGIRTFGDVSDTDYVIDYIAVDSACSDRFYVRRGYCVSNKIDGQGSSDHNPVIVDIVKRPDSFRWVEENVVTTGRTGIWSESISYNRETLKAELFGERVFTPTTPSDGDLIVMEVTTDLSETWGLPDPDDTAQAAMRMGTNGSFQVWALLRQGYGGQAGWMDISAEGVTPQMDMDYTFRFVFDYRSHTYTAAVQYGAEWRPLTANGATSFSLAVPASGISRMKFTGDGVFTSLFGEWLAKPRGFVLRLL